MCCHFGALRESDSRSCRLKATASVDYEAAFRETAKTKALDRKFAYRILL